MGDKILLYLSTTSARNTDLPQTSWDIYERVNHKLKMIVLEQPAKCVRKFITVWYYGDENATRIARAYILLTWAVSNPGYVIYNIYDLQNLEKLPLEYFLLCSTLYMGRRVFFF